MEKFLLCLFIAAILFYGRLIFKGVYYTADDLEFRQAGVKIDFRSGIITLKGKPYRVDQVTGIRMEAVTRSHRHGDSIAKTVTIDLDDIAKPHHKIMFISRGHSRKFMQRLAVALRKAGGPSFA